MENSRTYTIRELADQYNVNIRTIYVWLLPIREELLAMYPTKKQRLRVLLPKQYKRIQEYLG
ncbi:MAG: hypothetical protein C0594_16420 [Marinilabiliales bacterium]|nr:MAG: hypothetical protein C0594_16420 [Marinilabiliales bacterium]